MTKKKDRNKVYKTRNFWTVNPVTKIVPDKTKYKRNKKHKNQDD